MEASQSEDHRPETDLKSAVRRMIERFDTERGRHYYSKRMGAIESVFGNTRATLEGVWWMRNVQVSRFAATEEVISR